MGIKPLLKKMIQAIRNRFHAAKGLFQLLLATQALHRSPRPVLVFVSHGLIGGTLKHLHELQTVVANRVDVLLLRPARGRVEFSSMTAPRPFRVYWDLDQKYPRLLTLLQHMGAVRVHFHHTKDIPIVLFRLPQDLGVAYDFTAHDYYTFCPQVSLTTVQGRYCGEPPEPVCEQCLQERPTPFQETIQAWRTRHQFLLEGAQRVFVPAHDVAQRLQARFPKIQITVASHPDAEQEGEYPAPVGPTVDAQMPLRLIVLGALDPVKGPDVLEACAVDAKQRDLPLEFHLLGYAYRPLRNQPESQLITHGRYRDEELLALIDSLQGHVIWFPALWPETYSYTLSAAFQTGLPIVSTDLGAIPERLQQRPWSWVRSWETSPVAWNDFFLNIRENHLIPNNPPDLIQGTSPTTQHFHYYANYLDFLTERKD